ncbi:alkaline phosphatase D family protein [Oscillatoria sp. FACHB-1407]|nr:alkaline phosphatase D family protein [Oscillatoria sp. FACHB-1407]
MVWIPLSDHPIGEAASHRLSQLPLVLAGPMLRRTEPGAVTVWVALKHACEVTLQVYATQEQGHELDRVLLAGTRETIAIGQHLHIVAVTATPVASNILTPDRLYAYNLRFSPLESAAQEDDLRLDCTLLEALQMPFGSEEPEHSISYFQHRLPTFALPPSDLNHLKIVHGSCRKPHGSGPDALPLLDYLLERNSHDPNTRPHQLFLTGDQIYGDDVGDPWLWLLTDIGDALLGWQEPLPVEKGRVLMAKHCSPGQRSQLVEIKAGFTAGLRNHPEYAKSHLLSFGEYCAAYLLAWSPVLHPARIPDEPPHGLVGRSWRREASAIRKFKQQLWRVRRALANTPTYTVFDDHDISDDWYLNQAWCLRVLGKPLGRRVVQNGLQAYALFQAWGNTPEQFAGGRSGEVLVRAIAHWSASQGRDTVADQTIAALVGLPPTNPYTGLPQFQRDGEALILDRDPRALDWHYTVRGDRHEVVVLDTRTWRGYPADESPKAPPMLLSPTAFKRQLQTPLQEGDTLNQSGNSHVDLTLVVAPTNLVHMRAIDWVQQWDLKQGNVYQNDVGDAWNLHKGAFAALLEVLFQWRDRVVVLSGDIHYGYAIQLNYGSRSSAPTGQPTAIATPQVLAQLTSSAFKNAEWKTQIIHTRIKAIAPEPPQYWIGWQSSQLKHLPNATVAQQIHARWGNSKKAWMAAIHQPANPPDWYYCLTWIKRQPAQSVLRVLPSTVTQRGWLHRCIRVITWLWRNRWLQEGNEVVGLNNLGEVRFHWSEVEPKTVIQDLYWRAPWQPQQVISSRFEVPLTADPDESVAAPHSSSIAEGAVT